MSKYATHLKTCGVELVDLSISDIALSRSDAIVGIKRLELENTPVLGGDVFVESNGRICHAYANWSIQQRVGEADGEFLNRTIVSSLAYIMNYPDLEHATPLFVIVPKTL